VISEIQGDVVARGTGADDDHATRRAQETRGRQRRLARVLEDDAGALALAECIPK
jgi:hypothetical protein